MKTFVIGDIHGGYRALLQLLQRAKVTYDDKLIFLGDYVDGWSESSQLIEFLIDLEKKQTCIFIKGNHDIWCEQWLKTSIPNPMWLLHGGQLTKKSYEGISMEKKRDHFDFFSRMKFYHVSKQNDLFIHAGFTSMHGPEKEFHQSNFNWDRTLWEMAVTMDKRVEKDSIFYPKRLKLYREIYIGHTPTLYYEVEVPMHAINVWNIDTGAAFKGCLSAMNIETKEVIQSDELYKLYPKEKGRNKN